MNKFLFVVLLAFVAACDISEQEMFNNFKLFTRKYHKKYSSLQEYLARFRIFKKNFVAVSRMNRASYGVTKFFDMTKNEFRRKYLNLDISVLNTIKFGRPEVQRVDAPEAYDWREQGAVNAVKDQGSCGSCWAFSAVGNLEGLYYLKNKESMTFSEQQLVDCDNLDSGCNGGLMEYTFQWIQSNGGLMSDKDYPYKGYRQSCKQDESKYKIQVKGYNLLTTQNEDEILEFLYTTGPLSIALNADTLQYYYGGIDDPDEYECDPDGLNHGVTLIGWGVEDGVKYWIGKNSWGKSWGESGYFRMSRGKGTCGINTYVITALI